MCASHNRSYINMWRVMIGREAHIDKLGYITESC